MSEVIEKTESELVSETPIVRYNITEQQIAEAKAKYSLP